MRASFAVVSWFLFAGVLAASLGGPGVAPAAASTGTATAITGFQVTPKYGDYQTWQINAVITGTLVEAQDHGVGVPDETVTIVNVTEPSSLTQAQTTATTNAAGQFTAWLPLALTDGGNEVTASFAGTADYAATSVTKSGFGIAHLDFVLNRQTHLVVSAGSARTFTGQLDFALNGKLIPVPDAPIWVQLGNQPDGTDPHGISTTGADGKFTVSVTSSWGGIWSACVEYPGGGYCSNDNEPGYVSYKTHISKFSVPAKYEAHSTLTLSGTMLWWTGVRWVGASYGLVSIYERPASGGKWVKYVQLFAGTENGAGGFKQTGLYPTFKPGRYEWLARVNGSDRPAFGGAAFKQSNSVIHYATVVDRTCVTSFSVSHIDGQTRVRGRVGDSCGTGLDRLSFGPVQGKIKIYFHPRGTKTWRYLGAASASAAGSFAFSRDGFLSGYFRAVFPAQGYYRESTSRDVRAIAQR